jgi:hypothetical protein
MTSVDLKRYRGIKTIYEYKKGIFEERRGRAEDIKAVQLDGMPHGKNKQNYTLEEFMDYCEREEIKELMKLERILKETEQQIQEIEESKYIEILQKHYIEGKTLKQTAIELNRDESKVRFYNGKALKEYNKIGNKKNQKWQQKATKSNKKMC